MKFIVKYSLEKDVNNYLNSVWKFSYLKHGRTDIQNKLLNSLPKEFQENIAKAKGKQEAKNIITAFLDNLPQSYRNTTPLIVLGLEALLNKQKKEIIDKLETVYQKSFPFKTITIYLTTLTIQPYSYEDRWFMAYRNNTPDKHLDVAKHELNHFMFYYYFQKDLTNKNIGFEKLEKLKEALAILTNPEGNNKPDVKELEKHIQGLIGQPVEQIIESCLNSGLL
jgi:hypothetical protein